MNFVNLCYFDLTFWKVETENNWQATSMNPVVKQEPHPLSSAPADETSANYLGQVSPISPAPNQLPNAARLLNALGGVLPQSFQPNGNDQKLM